MLSGVFLLRLAERLLFPLLFHEPPRNTRSGVPRSRPLQMSPPEQDENSKKISCALTRAEGKGKKSKGQKSKRAEC